MGRTWFNETLFLLQLSLNEPNLILKQVTFHYDFKIKNHNPHDVSDFVYSIKNTPTLEDFDPHFNIVEENLTISNMISLVN